MADIWHILHLFLKNWYGNFWRLIFSFNLDTFFESVIFVRERQVVHDVIHIHATSDSFMPESLLIIMIRRVIKVES